MAWRARRSPMRTSQRSRALTGASTGRHRSNTARRARTSLSARWAWPRSIESSRQSAQRVRVEGERPACEHERVDPMVDVRRDPGARELGHEETHVPDRRMRHEDGPVEGRDDVRGDIQEARRPRERRRVNPVHVRRPADALPRVDERRQEGPPLAPDDAMDAYLEHAVARRIEPRHLQVDEGERRLLRLADPRAVLRAARARRESTFKPPGRGQRPSSPQATRSPGLAYEWRWSPRKTTTSPGSRVHDSPEATSTIAPFSTVRYWSSPGRAGCRPAELLRRAHGRTPRRTATSITNSATCASSCPNVWPTFGRTWRVIHTPARSSRLDDERALERPDRGSPSVIRRARHEASLSRAAIGRTPSMCGMTPPRPATGDASPARAPPSTSPRSRPEPLLERAPRRAIRVDVDDERHVGRARSGERRLERVKPRWEKRRAPRRAAPGPACPRPRAPRRRAPSREGRPPRRARPSTGAPFASAPRPRGPAPSDARARAASRSPRGAAPRRPAPTTRRRPRARQPRSRATCTRDIAIASCRSSVHAPSADSRLARAPLGRRRARLHAIARRRPQPGLHRVEHRQVRRAVPLERSVGRARVDQPIERLRVARVRIVPGGVDPGPRLSEPSHAATSSAVGSARSRRAPSTAPRALQYAPTSGKRAPVGAPRRASRPGRGGEDLARDARWAARIEPGASARAEPSEPSSMRAARAFAAACRTRIDRSPRSRTSPRFARSSFNLAAVGDQIARREDRPGCPRAARPRARPGPTRSPLRRRRRSRAGARGGAPRAREPALSPRPPPPEPVPRPPPRAPAPLPEPRDRAEPPRVRLVAIRGAARRPSPSSRAGTPEPRAHRDALVREDARLLAVDERRELGRGYVVGLDERERHGDDAARDEVRCREVGARAAALRGEAQVEAAKNGRQPGRDGRSRRRRP